jgi:hypothetical protein
MNRYEFEYEIIDRLIQNSGKKGRAACKLSCTIRTINRKLKTFIEGNYGSFKHRNSGKTPVNKISSELIQKILQLKQTKYSEFSIQFF